MYGMCEAMLHLFSMKLLFGIPIQYYGMGLSISTIISLIILTILISLYILVFICVISNLNRQNNDRGIYVHENPIAELV